MCLPLVTLGCVSGLNKKAERAVVALETTAKSSQAALEETKELVATVREEVVPRLNENLESVGTLSASLLDLSGKFLAWGEGLTAKVGAAVDAVTPLTEELTVTAKRVNTQLLPKVEEAAEVVTVVKEKGRELWETLLMLLGGAGAVFTGGKTVRRKIKNGGGGQQSKTTVNVPVHVEQPKEKA